MVVPFRGTATELDEVQERLAVLELADGDTVTVVDNAPQPVGDGPGVVTAPDLQTPGFARNRGAERGHAPWLVFLDADVIPPPGLLDAYFDPPPEESTGLLAGGVRDEPVGRDAGPAARWSYLQASMSQDVTMGHGAWAFAQTASAAVRRTAFETAGGFREDIRAGEDADLTFRLRAAGWQLERREHAAVVHRSRATVRGLVTQKACHGSAGAWLDRHYPGSSPRHRLPGLTLWALCTAAIGLATAVWRRDREQALRTALDPLMSLAFEYGRLLPNERPRRWRRP